MASFDDIEIRRVSLARSYLSLLRAQPGRPLALFAPRRVGKTWFLDRDLTPVARQAGFLPVYADLWLSRSAPLAAINHALEEALDDLTVPATRVGRLAKTAVRKVAAASASIELGDSPRRRPLPAEPALRLDALVARVAASAGKPLLLMLDEVQALAETSDGTQTIATLRAVLQKRQREVVAVFTGSSQEALATMTAAAGGPMYQFAQLIDFPALGDEYLEALAAHFSTIHTRKALDLDALRSVFNLLGCKPALMKDLVKAMSAEGETDVEEALQRFQVDERQVAGWRALLASLDPLAQAVLIAIANGQAPLSGQALSKIGARAGQPVTVGKIRAALERLRRGGILHKPLRGGFAIEDALFQQYLLSV